MEDDSWHSTCRQFKLEGEGSVGQRYIQLLERSPGRDGLSPEAWYNDEQHEWRHGVDHERVLCDQRHRREPDHHRGVSELALLKAAR